MLNALIFDIDGTMADTEQLHRAAFNAAFEEARLDWHWDEELYTRLLNVAGGYERILHYWRSLDPEEASGPAAASAARRLHENKTGHYARLAVEADLALRPGIARLVHEAQDAGMQLAIATTTSPRNVDTLLGRSFGPRWRDLFTVVCDGACTARKKPAPDVYLEVLKQLERHPDECLALEDSANGLRAASDAGISVLVTPTAFTRLHDFSSAWLVLPHLGDPRQPLDQPVSDAGHRWVDLAVLRRWYEGKPQFGLA